MRCLSGTGSPRYAANAFPKGLFSRLRRQAVKIVKKKKNSDGPWRFATLFQILTFHALNLHHDSPMIVNRTSLFS